MTIPSTAPVAEDVMDPADIVDYVIDLSPLLDEGESFSQIDFAVMPESVLLGLGILTVAPHEPEEFQPGQMRIWVTVDASSRADTAWQGEGSPCGIEFTATTDRSRTFQRTVAIKVLQQ